MNVSARFYGRPQREISHWTRVDQPQTNISIPQATTLLVSFDPRPSVRFLRWHLSLEAKPGRGDVMMAITYNASANPPSPHPPLLRYDLSPGVQREHLLDDLVSRMQIYSRAARSRFAQTFCRQRRDVTCAGSLLRSERFPSAGPQDNLVPLHRGDPELDRRT
ncbi:unnamed protein product [Pleuronectes platessa]|uniref:Uncharacterized protein n=1 Tax=Pleuronectes platessa TaxID=8262 RepID=A0A9N7TQD4_PLEPL|nr:unnamed protein product [Pleuronectes platessa]